MNPIFETTQNQFFHTQGELGYKLSQSDQAVKKALTRALDIWKKLRWSSAEIKMWSSHVEIEAKQKVEGIRFPEKDFFGARISYSRKIREISEWEKSTLATIKRYMTESNDMIHQIKGLNPPLTSDHIKPILKAMEKDQFSTLIVLKSVKIKIDQIAEIRERHREAPLPTLHYNPVS